ncbi:hypothetical protein ACM61V_03895 [Sphingomonas sp. TX0543]|uniref:hypothetical protein n=1 Tax=unclassified Sphingomonas TaxID=196159 RepID=UPI00148587DA|nr:hypothetical protein [Sphingomonas sp. 3P27F8]
MGLTGLWASLAGGLARDVSGFDRVAVCDLLRPTEAGVAPARADVRLLAPLAVSVPPAP